MARRHGSKGQVKMDPTGGATPAVVSNLNQWTLDLARDKEDVTCFGDTNKQYVLGLPDIQGEINGVWDETTTPDFLRVALGDIPVMLQLVPSTITPEHYFEGLAYLDAGMDVAADGAVTINGSFVAAGPWTLAPDVTP